MWVYWKRICNQKDQMLGCGRTVWIKLGKIVVFVSCGILLGAMPWILYAWRNGPIELLNEMHGGAIAGVEGLSWLSQNIQHKFNFLLLGLTVIFGIQPPWKFASSTSNTFSIIFLDRSTRIHRLSTCTKELSQCRKISCVVRRWDYTYYGIHTHTIWS